MTNIHKNRIQMLVNKLRTTREPQGQEFLKDENGTMCVLGFACDLYKQETGKGRWVDNDAAYAFAIGGIENEDILPKEVAAWYGFPAGNPEVIAYSKEMTLPVAELNDSGWSFKSIATAIEKTYLKPKKAKK